MWPMTKNNRYYISENVFSEKTALGVAGGDGLPVHTERVAARRSKSPVTSVKQSSGAVWLRHTDSLTRIQP